MRKEKTFRNFGVSQKPKTNQSFFPLMHTLEYCSPGFASWRGSGGVRECSSHPVSTKSCNYLTLWLEGSRKHISLSQSLHGREKGQTKHHEGFPANLLWERGSFLCVSGSLGAWDPPPSGREEAEMRWATSFSLLARVWWKSHQTHESDKPSSDPGFSPYF